MSSWPPGIPYLPASPAGGGAREPGSDVPLEPCCTGPTRPVDPCVLEGLTEAQLLQVQDGLHVACLHRCCAWPERRRELP